MGRVQEDTFKTPIRPPVAIGVLSEDHLLTFDSDYRLYPLRGSYDKTIAIINGKVCYVKFDTNKALRNSTFYSDIRASIAESMVSALIRSSDIRSRIRCADYRLVKTDGQFATISEPYYTDEESEVFLSTNYSTQCMISKQNYLAALEWGGEKLVDELSKKMERRRAADYIDTMSAFDLLTANNDRIYNAYNAPFGFNFKTREYAPVNMDFGGCLTNSFTIKTQEWFLNHSDYGEDDIALVSEIREGKAWVGLNKLEGSFSRFQINVGELIERLNAIVELCAGTDCEIYSQCLRLGFIKHLEKYRGKLWEEFKGGRNGI